MTHQDMAREVGAMVRQIATLAGESETDPLKTVGFAALILMRAAYDDPIWALQLFTNSGINPFAMPNIDKITSGIRGDLHG